VLKRLGISVLAGVILAGALRVLIPLFVHAFVWTLEHLGFNLMGL